MVPDPSWLRIYNCCRREKDTLICRCASNIPTWAGGNLATIVLAHWSGFHRAPPSIVSCNEGPPVISSQSLAWRNQTDLTCRLTERATCTRCSARIYKILTTKALHWVGAIPHSNFRLSKNLLFVAGKFRIKIEILSTHILSPSENLHLLTENCRFLPLLLFDPYDAAEQKHLMQADRPTNELKQNVFFRHAKMQPPC